MAGAPSLRRRTSVDISITLFTFLDADGTVVGVSNASRDLTGRKQAQLAAAHVAAPVGVGRDPQGVA